MNRFIFLACLAFVSAVLPAQNLDDLEFGSDESLEIITWNMKEFPLNGQVTLDSLSKAIYALDADVYAFQEMFDTLALRNMVDEMDGYETFFQDPDFGGLAVIFNTSSIELIDQYEIFYTSQYWNYFTRAPVVMEFNFQGEFYVLINNHFKCCGDGDLDDGNEDDEEYRRQQASLLMEQFIEVFFPVDNVFLVGDLNDLLTDPVEDNVFQGFLENPEMVFADMEIAQGNPDFWSFPGWPSHLDHILITDELFDELEDESSVVGTILIEEYLPGGLQMYNEIFSDHRPLGIKLYPGSLSNTWPVMEASEFLIYPNPLHGDRLLLNRKNADELQFIEVYNYRGEKAFESRFPQGQNTMKLDVSNLQPGQYFIRIENEVLKFIKLPGS